jgi:hypothetical protein
MEPTLPALTSATCIKLLDIPQEFFDEYNLTNYAHKGSIYFEIAKGVYGLKQAGKLANDLLTKLLGDQMQNNARVMATQMAPNHLFLILDDFGIEYCDHCQTDYLLAPLQKTYKLPPTGQELISPALV